MKKIAVFYLFRKSNNKDSFFNFLNSYKSFESGIEHDFYIILKGYKENDDISWIESELKNIEYSFIYCIDKGFDIYAYFYSSKKVKNKYVMFINSFSQINSDDWLFILFSRLSKNKKDQSISVSFAKNIILLIISAFILIIVPAKPINYILNNIIGFWAMLIYCLYLAIILVRYSILLFSRLLGKLFH